MPKRVLRFAIAGSLAIHVVAAHFVRPPAVSAATEPPPAKMTIVKIVPPIRKVVPTPTPRPQPQHRIAVRPRVRTPQLSHTSNSKGINAAHRVAIATPGPGRPDVVGPDVPPGPQPSAPIGTPEPTPPPTPSCTSPDVAARVMNAITPDTPEAAREEGISGVTEVRVDLGADGEVESVSIYRSSGSTLLDAAALRAAKASRYAAGQHDCHGDAGSYIFRADFDNQ
ncbi:MAG: TonB family protein [Candidatus Eremiobacteraeota bacterium]|nr:TonB family protein [Candidatus Eremiobacteraeota bacterium]